MPMLEWNDSLSIQVAEVDAQHKKLVDMVNTLHDAMKKDATETVLLSIINEMRQYSEVHFGTEEKFMGKYGYPETELHKSQHRDFIDKVCQVENKCKNGDMTLSMDILNFLSSWIVTHIFDTDKKLGAFLFEHGVS